MTASENYMQPTTKDLSGIPENQGFPAYDSSMHAGNTISAKNPHFAGQGTDSEATHDVVESSDPGVVGNVQHVPVLPGTKTPASQTDVDEKGTPGGPLHHTPWKVI